jgi:hypothetical protein
MSSKAKLARCLSYLRESGKGGSTGSRRRIESKTAFEMLLSWIWTTTGMLKKVPMAYNVHVRFNTTCKHARADSMPSVADSYTAPRQMASSRSRAGGRCTSEQLRSCRYATSEASAEASGIRRVEVYQSSKLMQGLNEQAILRARPRDSQRRACVPARVIRLRGM